jgi:hypothetical protein
MWVGFYFLRHISEIIYGFNSCQSTGLFKNNMIRAVILLPSTVKKHDKVHEADRNAQLYPLHSSPSLLYQPTLMLKHLLHIYTVSKHNGKFSICSNEQNAPFSMASEQCSISPSLFENKLHQNILNLFKALASGGGQYEHQLNF